MPKRMTRRRVTSVTSDDARDRALAAAAMIRRDGISLREASRRVHIDPRTVLRHAPSAFERRGRRWVAKPFDRIPREVALLQPDGPRYVVVRDSRTASAIAEQANGTQRYIQLGDESELQRLRGRRVEIGGVTYSLFLTPDQLDRLAYGGELHYELYRRE